MNNNFLVQVSFIIAGCGVLVIFFYLRKRRFRLLSTGIPVEGIVFDFVTSKINDSSNKDSVIRFLTLKQEWITQTYNISYPEFILKRGQKVEVFYNPDKPSDFILNLRIDKWFFLFLLVISILCFAWAAISLINAYNNQ